MFMLLTFGAAPTRTPRFSSELGVEIRGTKMTELRTVESKHKASSAELIMRAVHEIENRGNWSADVLEVLVWLHLHSQKIDEAFKPSARVVPFARR